MVDSMVVSKAEMMAEKKVFVWVDWLVVYLAVLKVVKLVDVTVVDLVEQKVDD